MTKINSFQQPGERYPSLRVIAFLFTLTGTILMAGGMLLLPVGPYALAWGTVATPPLKPWGPSWARGSTSCPWLPG